jgi:type 1 glutamine amidotransferase
MSVKTFVLVGILAVALTIGWNTPAPAQPAGTAAAVFGETFFNTVDANKDGFVTREELRATVGKWLAQTGGDSMTQEQLGSALSAVLPQAEMAAAAGASRPQPQTPKPEDLQRVMGALPTQPPAKPAQPRKVLVLAKANGFVHTCIPLAAKTVEALGNKTGAWSTTISYDASVITADNLKQYDVLLLDNTTGAFLDEPDQPAVHEARKAALLGFVRSGKGLVGIHAATDSYHQMEGGMRGGMPGGRGGARGGGMGGMLAGGAMTAADKNSDGKLTADELNGLADFWFANLDQEKSGKVSKANFEYRLQMALMGGSKGTPGRDNQTGTWPEFNRMIGGYFKWHWYDPTHIPYKIDDPTSPLTAMFKGPFALDDETYTMSSNSFSRENVHVLTSIDYPKMSEIDKAKENNPREDHDFGLSWIRREGNGRVFYAAHGHDEKIYANKTFLDHLTAGIQYAAGDLKANDAPSKK